MSKIKDLKEEYISQLEVISESIPLEQLSLELEESTIDDTLLMRLIDAYNLGKRIEKLEESQSNQ